MLSWSLNLFRVRGILLSVHFTFFLLLAVNAFDGWADAGWTGLWWNTAALLAFFVCVVLHELGHSFTAMHYGVGVRRILLMPIGGMAEFDGLPRQPRRELLITLAGPAVNFVIAGLLWFALPIEPPPASAAAPSSIYTITELGEILLTWNLGMGIFNLLPVFPMDGGRILRAMLATRMEYLRATFFATVVGKVLSLAGIGAAFYFEQPLLAVLFAFIFVMGEMEYRATKQRERDEEHMRATIARLRAISPSYDDDLPMLRPHLIPPPPESRDG